MKLLKTICVLGLTLCLATSVYAGTQSVKLSGDLAVRGLFRDKYNLGGATELDARTGTDREDQQWIMSTVETQIDADLTDNVSAVVRLVNQRDWNVYAQSITPGVTSLVSNGRGGYTAIDDEFDILVDLAYLELKEFLYSPLTLKIGRQDLWFGKGFIVGANQQNPGTVISATEYTAVNSFDSIRGTLDYDPWTVDMVYANIYTNSIQSDDSVDLVGTNIGYIFDSYNAESEGYYWYKRDRQIQTVHHSNSSDVHCLGLRGSGDPIANWTVAAEAAYQYGNAISGDRQVEERDRSAWGLDASVECRELVDQFAWKPVVSAEYIYYSGDIHAADMNDNGNAGVSGTATGWDPMYRGKFDSAYREFIGRYYTTQQFPTRARFYQSVADASFTNQHQALANVSVMPTDSLTANGRLVFFWLDEEISNNNSDTFIGTELDLQLTWDYTEDVTFGLLSAWFMPGNLYEDDNNTATDLVGSVKLSF
jgi:hypothetical protein